MSFLKNKSHLKFYPLLVIFLMAIQLAKNVLSARTIAVGPFNLPGGFFCCPLTFFLWDIITEVYGFKRAKQLIIYFLLGQIFFSLLINLSLFLPASNTVTHPEYFTALDSLSRVTFSMILSTLLGDYVNCYILDKLKIYADCTYLALRFLGASAIGELVITSTWVVLFYTGQPNHPDFFKLIFSLYLVKMICEIIYVIPANFIVNFIKKYEIVDVHKRYFNFDPFTLEKFVAPKIDN